jgi:hypothetical protein
MKKYRLLMNGKNFLLSTDDGKKHKHGFYQNMFIEADSPKQAERMALTKIWHDKELMAITLNKKNDPPQIHLETFWELDELHYAKYLETGRTFYLQKKWWQIWK